MSVSPIVLDERLRTAADLVRQGAYFADIGTDHAYLPVFLLENRRIIGAYASDVAKGPVLHAKKIIEEHGLNDRILLRTADGLAGLFDIFPHVTDIAVCGMGGELIAHLLSEAPLAKDPNLHFILQPMSRPAALRRFLAENGFRINEERLCRAAGRIYSCLSVTYTGIPYSLTALAAEIGAHHIKADKTPLFYDYIRAKIQTEEEKRNGKQKGGLSAEKEIALLKGLYSLTEKE